ncbi:MAG TPA: DNA gyrase/topoisomerase IV subunit A, partial [Faecalibacter sp.]
KAQQYIDSLEEKIANVKHHLENLVDFAVDYFKALKTKYGKDKERKTEIRTFDNIDASKVAVANTRFYVDRVEGFIGTSLKKDEFVFECSDIDDIVVFKQDGSMVVTKVDVKTFVGKGIIHVGVWRKNDKRTIYNLVYRDGKNGPAYQKRFAVTGITRDKEYDLTNGNKGSEILYFSANPNGEAEVVSVILKTHQRIKKLKFDLDFAELAVKGRSSKGNLVTKYPIKKIELKEEGISTLAPRQIWYDPVVRRLNADERGDLLGSFKGEDKILTINSTGEAKLVSFDLGNRFDDEMIIIEKWKPAKPITCIYYDGQKDKHFVKRFLLDDTTNPQVFFIKEDEKSEIKFLSTDYLPMIELNFSKVKGVEREAEVINLEQFIAVKGIKAQGNQLTSYKLKQIVTLESLPFEEPIEEEEVIDEEVQPTLFDEVEPNDVEE